jgi:hypothetical protein
MSQKKICIIWKWNDLKHSSDVYQYIPVEGEKGHMVCIYENRLDELHEWVEEFCAKVLPQSTDELIILCHNQNEYRTDKLKLLSAKCREKCSTTTLCFGGGKDYIYYNKGKKTGLINQTGGFQNGFLLGIDEKVTVFVADQIQSTFFQDVWSHYSLNKFKAPIYTYLREKLLLCMFGFGLKGTIRTWLEQIPTETKKVIDEFIDGNHPVFQKSNSYLADYQELFIARNHLIQLVDKPLPSATEVRSVTEALLKNIAGPIY